MLIDHIGIVVRSLERGIQRWVDLLGYSVCSDTVLNSRQGVRVVFLSKSGSTMVKLLEPTGADSPVFEFSRKGGGLHHLCFRCEDMKQTIGGLTEGGARLIVPPQPGEAFNNHDIAFLWIENNLNIELIDTTEKTGLTGEPAEMQSPAPSSDPCFQVKT